MQLFLSLLPLLLLVLDVSAQCSAITDSQACLAAVGCVYLSWTTPPRCGDEDVCADNCGACDSTDCVSTGAGGNGACDVVSAGPNAGTCMGTLCANNCENCSPFGTGCEDSFAPPFGCWFASGAEQCLAAKFVATKFVATTQGSANVPTNGAAKCNNYMAYSDSLVPVGKCYSENNNEWQTDPSNDIRQYFAQNMMFKCEMKADGTKQACLYNMNIGCTEQIEEECGLCYPCNGVEDQCECEIGGDASECEFYEKTVYDTTDSSMRTLDYCNADSSHIERYVVNMCVQGSATGQGARSTQDYACGGSAAVSVEHSAADCSDVPLSSTAAPLDSLVCAESTCNGVESPRADTKPEEPLPEPTEPSEGTDIIFLFDLSAGVSFDNVESQIEFVRTITNCVSTYAEVRVSAMTYGDKVKKLFSLGEEISFDMTEDDLVGGEPFADEALAAALEEMMTNGKDTNLQAVVLMSFNAPMTGHEACMGDYVSPQLEELREMDVSVMNIGINLDATTMQNLQCMVPAGEEDIAEDYLVNTDSLANLADEWGYTDCEMNEEKPEIIFLLDTSSGVSFSNFMDQMTFVDTMKDCFATYMEPRMSVMSYGDEVMKLQGLDDDNPNSHFGVGNTQMVGGDRNMNGALTMALEEYEQYGVDGANRWILLLSLGAPMQLAEPCVSTTGQMDYVSPTLQKLRDMDVGVTTHGINLDTAVMEMLRCIVDEVPDVIDEEDGLTNTETATALADQWGYTACAYGDQEDEPQGYEDLSGEDEDTKLEDPLSEPSTGIDIIFLFDLSSGATFDNVESQIEFAKSITNFYSCNSFPDYRASAMTYGDKVKKLFSLGDEISFDMTEDDLVGGEPFTDEALAAALEEMSINGKDTNLQAVVLMSNSAPMTGHEACSGDYVSPQLEELREMGVSVMNIGINLDVATMANLQCMVPAGMEDNAEDYLVNTDSLDTLAEEMGYTDCDGGEDEDTKLEEPSTPAGAEIVYLFDSSYGASLDNFKDQIEFAVTMWNCAAAYDHGEYRMSVMTYGDIVKKLFGLDDEVNFDMISEHDMVGGDPFVDGALAVALEELSINGKDGNFKAVALFSYSAPLTGHEACLGDYVSPILEELREMDIQVMNIGINLDAATMQSLQCMVPVGMEDNADDYLVNTDSLANLADEFCTEDEEYYTGESE